jgi:hypothetical protein
MESTALQGPGLLSRTRTTAGVARLAAALARHRGFIALSILAVGVLLALSGSAWFWHDEWVFIRSRSLADPAGWLTGHAQHFVAIHAAVYTALLAVFGTSTYLPFLAVAWAAHVAFVAAVYAIVDRHVGRGPALASAAVLLLLGSAGLNLLWAFQMGPMASGALAMWGIVVIRDRPGLAALLLGLGIATAGFALFFVPAAALYGWSRRALLASAVPVAVYGLWYLAIGQASAAQPAETSLALVVLWVAAGVMASAAALTGLGPLGALLLAMASPLLLCVRDRRLAAMGIVAIVTEYSILGLTRPGQNSPGGQQYLYFGAAFLALVLASAWPAVPRWGRPAVALLAGAALASNLLALIAWSQGLPVAMAVYDPLCQLCPAT